MLKSSTIVDIKANLLYHIILIRFSDAAGNQCCYNQQGSLMFSNDNVNGSTPDRSHTWGAVPYGQPDYVPSMSHWIHDVVSFYYCCLWDNYRSCDRYMDLRPTRDCTGYTPPMPGKMIMIYLSPDNFKYFGQTLLHWFVNFN